MNTTQTLILCLFVFIVGGLGFAFLVCGARRRVPPRLVTFPDGSAACGTVTSDGGRRSYATRAITMSGGLLYTDAGRFLPHPSRPGVWVCIRDADRHFTFNGKGEL